MKKLLKKQLENDEEKEEVTVEEERLKALEERGKYLVN